MNTLFKIILGCGISLSLYALPYNALQEGTMANNILQQDTFTVISAKLAALGCDIAENAVEIMPYLTQAPAGKVGLRTWSEVWVVSACNKEYPLAIDFQEMGDSAIYRIVDDALQPRDTNELQKVATAVTQDNEVFEQRIVTFLQSQFPDAKEMSVDELLPEIKNQIHKAQKYQFTTEQNIVMYITTAWLLGIDFDTEFPVVQEVLSGKYSEDEKSNFLQKFTTELFETLEKEK